MTATSYAVVTNQAFEDSDDIGIRFREQRKVPLLHSTPAVIDKASGRQRPITKEEAEAYCRQMKNAGHDCWIETEQLTLPDSKTDKEGK